VSAIFIVLPLALLVVFAAVVAYTWAARRGQFDDLTTPALRMLHEDEAAPRSEEERAARPGEERTVRPEADRSPPASGGGDAARGGGATEGGSEPPKSG
jgi:cbb3-type cytochrome oxidase maturation protein